MLLSPPRLILLLVLALLLLAPLPARAQAPAAPASPAEPRSPVPAAAPAAEPAAEAPDSPRASLRRFARLAARNGDFQAAARYLALEPEQKSRGVELVQRLRAVIERRLDIHLDVLSPDGEGNTGDGLPPGVDKLGDVEDRNGRPEPVFLVRTRDEQGGYWAFSRQTVARIDGWYDALPDRWIRERIPERLQLYGPGRLMWWQWLALPVLLLVAMGVGRVLGALVGAALFRLSQRTATQWDERLLGRISPALTLLCGVVTAALLLPWLALLPDAQRLARALLGGVATVATFWALWRSVDVWADFLGTRAGVVDNPSARSLVALLRNFAKAFVAMGGILATLAALGYPVTTVLAGLGIGGVALAFGAQKTVENLFGSVALAVDQPFRLGDFVKIEDFVGNVERIGMRSTQIRTLDRTLVSLPNGMLADMRIEDYASRDRIRLHCTVGVVYGTTRAQMLRIIAGMERALRAHPLIWPDTLIVRFAGFSASSLDIEVMAWFRTSDYNVFRDCRQEALFEFMGVVEAEGSSFAFPTQTVHLVQEPAAEATHKEG